MSGTAVPSPSGRTLALAIDIGGTKVALGLVTDDGELVASARFATPRGAPASAAQAVLEQASAFAAEARVVAAGIVLPAVVEEGVLAWAAESIDGWQGLSLRALAEQALHVPTVVEFDGYGATLGEAWRGHARGYPDALIVIVGTGVGAGIMHGGRLYRGRTAIAGGIGWIRFPGGDGLGPKLEEVAAGPGILAAARALRPDASYADTEAVFASAAAGDETAASVVEHAMQVLSAGVGAVVAALAPDIVVLGGSVGARPDVVASVRRLLPQVTQPFAAAGTRVEGSALGPLSSLYGAARFAHLFAQGKEP